MERIRIKETKRTPEILFDGDKGILNISGRSFPEDAEEFYKIITDGINDFKKEYDYPLKVTLDFELFNTASARQILALLKELKDVASTIRWVYEEGDDDMLESGQDYESIMGFKFIFEKKPE